MASAPSPTSAYRAENGIPQAGSYDPTVVGWIKRAATQTGADPRALLATSLQEDGARLKATGDQGTSFGPFQFHEGGALGNHPPAWASTYAAVLNRAQEFARLGVHGGTGAAAVQRPRDRQLYAQGVDSLMGRAASILAHFEGGAGATAAPLAEVTRVAPAGKTIDHADVGSAILDGMSGIHANAVLAKLPGSSAEITGNPMQDLLDQNAAIAHIEAPTLPTSLGGLTEAPTPTSTVAPKLPKIKAPVGKVIAGPTKIIGLPFQGTHAVAFNERGGSNNWESERAVDIATPVGTPIRAPVAGVIGSQIGSLGSGGRFAGLRAHLVIPGNELYFAHLSRLAVHAGQHVQAGQIIGYSGSANGVAHLHLAAKTGNPGRYA